ncbi:uncharacterized protein LOC123550647 [Mercenaria mercenaria]|uniref:uncharacterized protein LOC123550647 n=1 Tax=Mercenaria mercenaria TaxID=6596 RepID=UPI00234EC37E|nr:uncharacterized protein LOC123550647 [Mercenaria mercenaria]
MTIVNKFAADNLKCGILAGSKAEGVSCADDPDSDIDMMIVRKQFVCCDDLHKSDFGHDKVVLEMARDSTAPGYTRLKCKSSDRERIVKSHHMVHKLEGQMFVGHLLNEDHLSSRYEKDHFDIISGPAFSFVFSLSHTYFKTNFNFPVVPISVDSVESAISCICTGHLQKWKERMRFNSWPGQELIEEISQMNGHVVPVGYKGSEHYHLQWRICYTEAELKLIHSLNEVQLKLYVLLKMVAKKILKPICSEISSYIMKNLLFWFAERSPAYRFKNENLMGLLFLSLRSLQHCIHKKRLSNYMIPDRNLFAGRFDDDTKTRLVEELHKLIYVQGLSFYLHYEGFEQLSSAIAKAKSALLQKDLKPNSIETTILSTYTRNFLQKAVQYADTGDVEFLTTVLNELTEEQIERNICDIQMLVCYK